MIGDPIPALEDRYAHELDRVEEIERELRARTGDRVWTAPKTDLDRLAEVAERAEITDRELALARARRSRLSDREGTVPE